MFKSKKKKSNEKRKSEYGSKKTDGKTMCCYVGIEPIFAKAN